MDTRTLEKLGLFKESVDNIVKQVGNYYVKAVNNGVEEWVTERFLGEALKANPSDYFVSSISSFILKKTMFVKTSKLGTKSLFEVIQETSLSNLKYYVLHTLCVIHDAYKKYGFVHGDLHVNNIIVDENTRNTETRFKGKDGFLYLVPDGGNMQANGIGLIDYGASSIEGIYKTMVFEAGIISGDVFRFLTSLLSQILILNPNYRNYVNLQAINTFKLTPLYHLYLHLVYTSFTPDFEKATEDFYKELDLESLTLEQTIEWKTSTTGVPSVIFGKDVCEQAVPNQEEKETILMVINLMNNFYVPGVYRGFNMPRGLINQHLKLKTLTEKVDDDTGIESFQDLSVPLTIISPFCPKVENGIKDPKDLANSYLELLSICNLDNYPYVYDLIIIIASCLYKLGHVYSEVMDYNVYSTIITPEFMFSFREMAKISENSAFVLRVFDKWSLNTKSKFCMAVNKLMIRVSEMLNTTKTLPKRNNDTSALLLNKVIIFYSKKFRSSADNDCTNTLKNPNIRCLDGIKVTIDINKVIKSTYTIL